MANAGLRGPFPLTENGINRNVTRRSPGAYALGHSADNTFYIYYIGRSDADVRDRLHYHKGTQREFKYEYYASSKSAFEKECRLYHAFSPPGNKVHPSRPAGRDWKCPVCGIFD